MTGTAKNRTIDTHTHILADATIGLLNKEIPKLGIKLTPIDDNDSVIEVAGTPYRPMPRFRRSLLSSSRRPRSRTCSLPQSTPLHR